MRDTGNLQYSKVYFAKPRDYYEVYFVKMRNYYEVYFKIFFFDYILYGEGGGGKI